MGDAFPRRGGCARRVIDLRRHDAHTVVGWLEDDFHHFGITAVHRDNVIVDVRTAAPRYPYSTCPAAGGPLRALIGEPLIQRASDIGRLIPMRLQCTHLFDLAGLVLAHCAAGRHHRRYEAIVSDRPIIAWEEHYRRLLGPGHARLACDGREVLAWDIDRRMITGPGLWAGQSLTEGFRERTEAMPPEPAEHACVLRRAILISSGRTLDLDRFPTAASRGLTGLCYTFQQVRRHEAQRIMGSARNFEHSAAGMLAFVNGQP